MDDDFQKQIFFSHMVTLAAAVLAAQIQRDGFANTLEAARLAHETLGHIDNYVGSNAPPPNIT